MLRLFRLGVVAVAICSASLAYAATCGAPNCNVNCSVAWSQGTPPTSYAVIRASTAEDQPADCSGYTITGDSFTMCQDRTVWFAACLGDTPGTGTDTDKCWCYPYPTAADTTVFRWELDGSPAHTGGTWYHTFDTSGNYLVDLYVDDQPACQCYNDDPVWLDSIWVKVVGVSSVVWEAIDSPLDDNPNTGGGKRIYPGKQNPNDAVDRSIVRVKATVSAAVAGLPVRFKSFDVDDPSADSAPIDDNDSGTPPETGNDNRGTPKPGTLSAYVAQTNANGVATVEFTVTMQPGDNFRVAASCDASYLADCEVTNTTTVKHPTDEELPTAMAKITDMLTVWRKLHVEVDSMGAPSGTTVTGNLTDVTDNGDGSSTVTTDQDLGDDSVDRFEDGVLTNNSLDFDVLGNTNGNNFTVTVCNIGETTPATGAFSLVDDDVVPGDVPDPITTVLAQKFVPAYVTVLFDGGGDAGNDDDDAPFNLNVADYYVAGIDAQAALSRDSSSSAGFWTTHCLGAFQGRKNHDRDPDTEGCNQGVSSGRSAIMFSEQAREYNYTDN